MSDVPMPLAAAVEQCFPHGGATVNTLRRAIRAGDLAAELIGKQYMVTAGDIEDWREKICRARAKARGSISRNVRAVNRSMSSGTERMKSAQDALQRMLRGQPKPSETTSPARSGQTRASADLTGSAAPR